MKTMKFKDYDRLCAKLAEIPNKRPTYWPSIEDLEQYVVPAFTKYCDYLIFLLETNQNPVTEEDKKSKSYINRIMRENLALV